jgi:hypothetical protein
MSLARRFISTAVYAAQLPVRRKKRATARIRCLFVFTRPSC